MLILMKKIMLILYPLLENSTTCTAIFQGQTIPGLNERIKERFEIDTETENQWKTEYLTYK